MRRHSLTRSVTVASLTCIHKTVENCKHYSHLKCSVAIQSWDSYLGVPIVYIQVYGFRTGYSTHPNRPFLLLSCIHVHCKGSATK